MNEFRETNSIVPISPEESVNWFRWVVSIVLLEEGCLGLRANSHSIERWIYCAQGPRHGELINGNICELMWTEMEKNPESTLLHFSYTARHPSSQPAKPPTYPRWVVVVGE